MEFFSAPLGSLKVEKLILLSLLIYFVGVSSSLMLVALPLPPIVAVTLSHNGTNSSRSMKRDMRKTGILEIFCVGWAGSCDNFLFPDLFIISKVGLQRCRQIPNFFLSVEGADFKKFIDWRWKIQQHRLSGWPSANFWGLLPGKHRKRRAWEI